eukprot:CAMPEP_0202457816 /NCGR_PEP_ID=MMETSP1360-20130828/14720_1 /ASSEMBLY_ACC=CAM_ASM_000848 /TAXON_ID=515479 /ORGANISM="Licmophora paradoxa, Strain CCMP2313" /LENGTH=394 /DNA_ID=CAMNT_0049077981 /DNA_START=1025 /DNA_END=2209 /DNA_ORIENTATION=+
MVLWQSVWYVVGLSMSYSIFFFTFYQDGVKVSNYWYYIVFSVFSPLQGFWNAGIYFRRRLSGIKIPCLRVGRTWLVSNISKGLGKLKRCFPWVVRKRKDPSPEEEELQRQLEDIIEQSGEDPIKILEASGRLTCHDGDKDGSIHEEEKDNNIDQPAAEKDPQYLEVSKDETGRSKSEAGKADLGESETLSQNRTKVGQSESEISSTGVASTAALKQTDIGASRRDSAEKIQERNGPKSSNAFLTWSSKFFKMSSEEIIFASTASSVQRSPVASSGFERELDEESTNVASAFENPNEATGEPTTSTMGTSMIQENTTVRTMHEDSSRSRERGIVPKRSSKAFLKWSSNFFKVSSEEVVFGSSIASSAQGASVASSVDSELKEDSANSDGIKKHSE